MKRFLCIHYGTNIEVKIRDCPGAFGTDGGSAISNVPLRYRTSQAIKNASGKEQLTSLDVEIGINNGPAGVIITNNKVDTRISIDIVLS